MAREESNLIPEMRFPAFVDPWSRKYLGDIANIYDGTHQTPKYTRSGVKFVSVENISDIKSSDKYISEEAFEKEFKNKPKKNDIFMTRITAGVIGATAIVTEDEPLAYYVSLALIRCFTNDDVSFIRHRIESREFKHELHKRIIHVAFPKKINLGDIGKCKITLPTLKEQKKIAAFLSTIDDKLNKLRRKRELLKTYKCGLMQKLFSQEIRFKQDDGSDFPSWKEQELGELVDITTGNSNREDSTEAGKYVFFDRSSDIRASSKFLYDCKAIIVAGEGKDFIPRYFEGKFDLHQRAYAIMNFSDNYSKYFYYWIFKHRNHFLKYSVGSTMPSLRMESFTKFPILLPKPEEQKKIVKILVSMDRKIEAVAELITQLETFKKGLLQKMFV